MTRHSRILVAAKARPYSVEPFASHSYWFDGALVCGGCDAPIYQDRCYGCETIFTGEHPAEPIPTYGERRQAHFDAYSHAPLTSFPIISNLGREGVGN